ncbi:MAG: CehA/McbA family metallohydrolase [Anaerolineae bacterium]|nr:CehA/McbA family metallohydrolase [Anaerolineae bacterium]MDW8070611.1 CehA/McbA family metallohydrolase [Anaerolineae bacterium]
MHHEKPSSLHSNPFQLPGRWYRGNLHTHSKMSDGAHHPNQVVKWYAENGYDFIAFTEHDRWTDAEVARQLSNGLLVLPGVELSVGLSRQCSPMHVVVIGDVNGLPMNGGLTPTQALTQSWQSGAFAFLAHPHWSGLSLEELAVIDSIPAIESFNYASDLENHKGLATIYWDDILGRGQATFGVATDDAHFHEADHGGGWVMVKASRFSAEALIAALRAGHFYSSSGPEIYDIRMVDDQLHVKTSPASAIYWVSSGCFGWHAHAAPGQTIESAAFYIPSGLKWIRIEVCDPQRRWAWSNPIFLMDQGSEQHPN